MRRPWSSISVDVLGESTLNDRCNSCGGLISPVCPRLEDWFALTFLTRLRHDENLCFCEVRFKLSIPVSKAEHALFCCFDGIVSSRHAVFPYTTFLQALDTDIVVLAVMMTARSVAGPSGTGTRELFFYACASPNWGVSNAVICPRLELFCNSHQTNCGRFGCANDYLSLA